MSEFRADLHCHSICSDGTMSPEEIVRLAHQKGLSALSITDHDTIDAYSLAAPLCKELNISLLPGVEFSTTLENTSIHILGYRYQVDDPAIQAFCNRHMERRLARNQAIIELLTKKGLPLSEDDLKAAAPQSSPGQRRTFGRPHIALAMMQKGYVSTIQEAFRKYIGEGCPCFVQGQAFTVEESIDVIHNAKGLAVIAHPHLIKKSHLLDKLLEMDFDGIECFYGSFPSKDHKRWLKIAEKKHWLITGGSDFHGSIKPNLELGASWIGQPEYEAILGFAR